jgi:hypothetical protein
MSEILMFLHGRELVIFKKISLSKKTITIMEIFGAKLCVHDHAEEQ